jgi:hypothetical protein
MVNNGPTSLGLIINSATIFNFAETFTAQNANREEY